MIETAYFCLQMSDFLKNMTMEHVRNSLFLFENGQFLKKYDYVTW